MKKALRLRDENGFTLAELLVASVCTTIVLGSAVALTSQIQLGYRRHLEDSGGEQEARYAIEWIGRYLRSAGNNPFNVTESDCPGADTTFYGIVMDPNGDGEHDDITIQGDANPPDGRVGGAAPACDQANEHVTISFDAGHHAIRFLDEAAGEDATTRTDEVIDGLEFVYLDSDRHPATLPANIFYVQTRITISHGRVLTSEIRVRGR